MLARMTTIGLDRTPPTLGEAGGDARCPECKHEQTGVEMRRRPTECARAINYGMGDVDACGCTNTVHSFRIVPDFIAG